MDIFPMVYNTTTFAFCNSAAKLATIFAPMVAEADHLTAAVTFTLLALVAFFASLFVRPKSTVFY